MSERSGTADRTPTSKGHLNPNETVRMTRLPPGRGAAELVRHYWIPRWDLPAGQTQHQEVLGYPACNLVVEPGGITVSGPTTRASHRDLTGRGWAVGALLRPAAGPAVLALVDADGAARGVASLVDRECRVTATADPRWSALHAAVTQAMASGDLPAAAATLERFLLPLAAALTPAALLANRIEQAVESSSVQRVDELARALAVSPRSLQRVARAHVGVTPLAMIRRHRLQDAADVLRQDPGADLATVAAEHGYADHAHLTREFHDVVGFTPSQYRGRTAPGSAR